MPRVRNNSKVFVSKYFQSESEYIRWRKIQKAVYYASIFITHMNHSILLKKKHNVLKSIWNGENRSSAAWKSTFVTISARTHSIEFTMYFCIHWCINIIFRRETQMLLQFSTLFAHFSTLPHSLSRQVTQKFTPFILRPVNPFFLICQSWSSWLSLPGQILIKFCSRLRFHLRSPFSLHFQISILILPAKPFVFHSNPKCVESWVWI